MRTVLLLAATLLTSACSARSVLVKRPEDRQVDAAINARWDHEIQRVAQDGDWILTRSYFLVADGIAAATTGTPLSHASIYSAERGTIIEAVDGGVREIPLAKLLERNHYAIVVRPSRASAAERSAAVDRARAKIGTPFDVAGMFGFGADDRFYCSELVWWASQGEARFGHERVITPSELMDYGQVVYWSGERDDAQLVRIAEGDLAATASVAAR